MPIRPIISERLLSELYQLLKCLVVLNLLIWVFLK